MRIGISDHYEDPDPGELDKCGSGSETAGSVETVPVIRKVRYFKTINYRTFMILISQRHLICRNCMGSRLENTSSLCYSCGEISEY
jgi:hypothetical protein